MAKQPSGDAPTAPGGPVTRAAVARLAGVAPSTVSLVLNGRGDQVKLAAATQERVRAAARQLHYVPNAAARALAARRSSTIGLLLSGPRDPVRPPPAFAETVLSATGRARELGYFILMLPCGPAQAPDALTRMRDASVAGLVCEARAESLVLGRQLARSGFPVVWIRRDRDPHLDDEGPVVSIDQEVGVGPLAEHLLASGRRSLVIILPRKSPDRPELDTQNPRYLALARAFGGDTRIVAADDWTPDGGRRAMHQVLAGSRPPDAVFAATDLVAAGVLRACRDAGLSVPRDVAVAGFGGFEIGEYLDPPLTTVAWPLAAMTNRAVELLTALIDGADHPDHVVLPTELVIRSST